MSKAVLGQVAGRSPASVRRYGCALRSFLRYCYLTGLVERDLSARRCRCRGGDGRCCPKASLRRKPRRCCVPAIGGGPAGRRDYAVIVLMLRLGLRASEVATLRLDDLDWRAGQLTVHGKGGRVDQLPLPVDVGEAIAAYLCRGRPRTAGVREVFLRVQPPHVGLTRSGVKAIVAGAARRAGLGVVRPHRLRHTAASDMLRAGVPLAEIGQVLRHRSLGSTAAYARVDVERLRTIARPWPTGAAS